MNFNYLLKVLFLLLAIPLSVITLHAEDVKPPSILRAAEVAYQDFSAKLDQGRTIQWEYSDYVGNIQNYDIGLSESDTSYIVVFLLKQGDVKINGGGGEYKINKGDFRVMQFTVYK